ncbi:ornithine cyclodeaminase family protein [Achromobacter sp. DH1f]|uniref:ornithine cyclodeaminase family protein n=1 Tax=Achromobacter sp. DH1f TaxID=1397275 RepID=UPI00046AFEC8|nr:ornithine cyclodeaminase family protein [Achromobacter sp. DH1f]
MLHITDAMVDAAVTPLAAQAVLRNAFLDLARGEAAMQARKRTQASGVKLSTLGAVIPGQGHAGAKVYTTIEGKFSFVIVLFSSRTGQPLATVDAGALTRIRTAACTTLVAQRLAPRGARTLGLFGAGTQGAEHAVQLSRALPLGRILVSDPYLSPQACAALQERTGLTVQAAQAEEVARQADVIVTASRSTTPLFEGAWLRPGVLVAAIGSSLPTTRELDDATLRRARIVIAEWQPQTWEEAGDFILAADGALDPDRVVDLGVYLTDPKAVDDTLPPENGRDIHLYKSVGVGLEDIALAGHAYETIVAASRG